MMCDECSVQRLCWISKKLWSLCWLSGQSWSGHLIMKWKRKVTWFKQKSVERLLSWILSKEKFMPHDIKSIYIIFRWTRIQTPWNWSFSALEWPTTFPLFLPLIDWWDHLESWRKMLHFDHRRGLLLFIFVGSGHSRRFIPIPGNFKNVLLTFLHFTFLYLYKTVNDVRYFFRHSLGCSAPGMVAADCLSRKNKKQLLSETTSLLLLRQQCEKK